MFTLINRILHPGRALAMEGHRQRKQRVRDNVDRMRKEMGMKPIKWGKW